MVVLACWYCCAGELRTATLFPEEGGGSSNMPLGDGNALGVLLGEVLGEVGEEGGREGVRRRGVPAAATASN